MVSGGKTNPFFNNRIGVLYFAWRMLFLYAHVLEVEQVRRYKKRLGEAYLQAGKR